MQNEMDVVKNQLLQIDDLKEENKDLKTKCSSLEARCESLQASVNLLIKDQKWEYSMRLLFQRAIGKNVGLGMIIF